MSEHKSGKNNPDGVNNICSRTLYGSKFDGSRALYGYENVDIKPTAAELLNFISKPSEEAGIDSLKAKLLMAHLLNVSLPALPLHKDIILTAAQLECFITGFHRLLRHEPLQYILGTAHFYGLELNVSPGVLIPRPETEGLVEWVATENHGYKRVLEIGTGSGAIALALKSLNPLFEITATDISTPALIVAKGNARKLGYNSRVGFQSCSNETSRSEHVLVGLESYSTIISVSHIRFIKADMFPAETNSCFDIIVSNPPYISISDYQALDKEVRLYEPKLALAAGKDGLSCYRRIISHAGKHSTDAGKVYLEIGEGQAAVISDLAKVNGWSEITVKQDLAGKDRYIRLERKRPAS